MTGTWGKFRRAAPEEWPEERVLREVAQAGYAGTSAGHSDKRTPQETLALFARHGLRPAPGYLSLQESWDRAKHEQYVAAARRHAAACGELGLTEFYVAVGGQQHATPRGRTRWQIAGQVTAGDAMPPDDLRATADGVNAVARAFAERGVRACFHNHVGTVIETRAEVERLLELCDRDAVWLGPDTGHLQWAGDDAAAFFRDHADRILTVHLKDVDAAVIARGRAEGWEYGKFTAAGVFVELGRGCVDVKGCVDALRAAGKGGWLLNEQDVTQLPTALESVTISRAYLRTLGL